MQQHSTHFFQTVDKTTDFRQLDESFRPPFSKGGAVEKRKNSLRELRDWINPISPPSSHSAECEIPLTAFSFASFSLAPLSCKRKATKEFAQFQKLYAVGLQTHYSTFTICLHIC